MHHVNGDERGDWENTQETVPQILMNGEHGDERGTLKEQSPGDERGSHVMALDQALN